VDLITLVMGWLARDPSVRASQLPALLRQVHADAELARLACLAQQAPELRSQSSLGKLSVRAEQDMCCTSEAAHARQPCGSQQLSQIGDSEGVHTTSRRMHTVLHNASAHQG
jgi:hypothetical protein